MSGSIVALDLSLTGLGVCAVSHEWDLDPRRVRTWTLETKPDVQLAHRLDALARDVRTLVIYSQATEVWVEQTPRGTLAGHDLVELRAAVRLELWRSRLPELRCWWPPSARKLLYGRDVPHGLKDSVRKAWLLEPLRIAGLTLANHNECDAWCGANWALAQVGAPHLSNLCGPPPSKARKRKAGRALRELFDGKAAAE